jgi:hypothetical protein
MSRALAATALSTPTNKSRSSARLNHSDDALFIRSQACGIVPPKVIARPANMSAEMLDGFQIRVNRFGGVVGVDECLIFEPRRFPELIRRCQERSFCRRSR